MTSEHTPEKVRIVKLAPMRVASVHGFGEQPEDLAWTKLKAWAGPKGYLDDPEQHRIFGFDNPTASPGSPNRGYEFWVQVGPEIEADDLVRIVEFAGGDYAVSRVEVTGDPFQVIPDGWQRLHRWCEEQGLLFGNHQWLEVHISGPDTDSGFTLDLHMPIVP